MDEQGSGSELAIAAVVNVVTYRALFSAINLPGWWGGMLAAAAMAVAADDQANPKARSIAGGLSAPGAIAIQAIRSNNILKDKPCCAPCAAGEVCESEIKDATG